MKGFSTGAEAGGVFGEQAASGRILAQGACTSNDFVAGQSVALQFEADAARINPVVIDGIKDVDAAALVSVQLALERQTSRWHQPRTRSSGFSDSFVKSEIRDAGRPSGTLGTAVHYRTLGEPGKAHGCTVGQVSPLSRVLGGRFDEGR